MSYTPDELWQQAISSSRARIIRGGDLETTVEFYGVYIIKSGLGYEYKTSHSGGEYYDKHSIALGTRMESLKSPMNYSQKNYCVTKSI